MPTQRLTRAERRQYGANAARILDAATPLDIEEGCRWYREAHQYCLELAELDGFSVEQTAGVVAALSPRLSWDLNRKRAMQLIVDGSIGGIAVHVAKAEKILAGADPLDVLRGNKVRAFYRNLSKPFDSDAITIDRHSYSVLMGRVVDDYGQKQLSYPWYYEELSEIYRCLGTSAGLRGLDVQAITWLTWRRIKGGRLF